MPDAGEDPQNWIRSGPNYEAQQAAQQAAQQNAQRTARKGGRPTSFLRSVTQGLFRLIFRRR